MIKLDNVGQQAVYYTSPYFSKIDLTDAYIKAVKWDKAGQEGYMIVSKNNKSFKIGLFPKVYQGRGNLERVGTPHFKLGFIYNLKQLSD
ncbi:MAG: Hypothetical protein AJITA_00764 [Acetilactobacillus jinshanensis]